MIYLDNAATSFPKPEKVYKEVMNCMKNYAANPGRSSHKMAVDASSKIIDCRMKLCKLFNISNPMNIIFTSNATEALNIAIKGILKPGEHVISTMIEHNSVLRPLYYLKGKGVEVTLLQVDSKGKIDIKELKKEIKKNTKALIVNHASNVLGTVQNIDEIGKVAKDNGLIFMVDASQSAGIIPINVELSKIDLLAFPGHKGLYGVQGTGGLYIRENIELESFKEGGTGSNSSLMTQPDFLPDKFESGTLNTPGIAGLCEGVDFILKTGINKIREHENNLANYLIEQLKKLDYIKIYGGTDYDNRASVISINIDNKDPSYIGELLDNCDIAVRTGYHCAPLIHNIIGTKDKGTVRISLGYFNTIHDIERLIEALKNIFKRGV